jgi:predicted phosphoribosyltransferase
MPSLAGSNRNWKSRLAYTGKVDSRWQFFGRCVILVDDGLATGATMRVAVLALRLQRAARIVVAVPIGAPEVCSEFESEVDEIVCGATPHSLPAVGDWYEDFLQVTDEDVGELLQRVASIKASFPPVPLSN